MSNASAWTSPSSATTDQSVTTQYQGRTFQVHRMNFIYHITQQDRMSGYMGALVDSGTNGGMAGSDTRVLSTVPHAHVDITGVGGSVMYPLSNVLPLLKPLMRGTLSLSCLNTPTNPILKQFTRSLNLSISAVSYMTQLSLLADIKWSLPMKGTPYLFMSETDSTTWTCPQLPIQS